MQSVPWSLLLAYGAVLPARRHLEDDTERVQGFAGEAVVSGFLDQEAKRIE